MVTTRLEISTNNTITNFQTMPFAKDVPVVLTYNLADIREPDKRKATFSKTIVLAATNEINKLFENIFEVNIETQYFNKNLKTPCKYYVNEILNFKGDLQLIKIVIGSDNNIAYECSVIGANGSLFVDIGEKYITGNTDSADNLDFSAYDHTYTRAYQQTTSLANYGTGLGCLYPFIDNGTNGGSDNTFYTENFIPSFHAYEYIKKIIEKTGRTFTSSILSSAEFKKYLIYPNLNAVSLSTAQLAHRQWYVGLNADVTLSSGLIDINHTDETTAPFFDAGAQSTATIVTLNDSGFYNVCAHDKYQFSFTHTDATVTYCVVDFLRVETQIQNSSNGGASYWVVNSMSSYFNNLPTNTFNKVTNYTHINEVATGEMGLASGNKMKHHSGIYNPGTIRYYNASNVQVMTGTGTPIYKLLSGTSGTSFYGLATKKTLVSGNTLLANNALPTKIKQKDILKSIIQALNLYIDIDPTNDNNIIIESFDTFYNTTTPVNYDGKTDLDKEQTVNPNLLEGKRYIYTYAEDKDYWNDLYKKNNNEVFGTERIDITNDFIKNDKENKLIFSSTPNVANYGLGIAHPRIYKIEQNIIKTIVPNIRLLYCGGVKSTNGNGICFAESGATDLWTSSYLYAGHTDDPMNPTLDLNFGTPKEVFYSYPNAYFTNNNLYNRFHKYYLETLTGRDSKMMTKYIWLNAKDINQFNFRNRIFIDGAYWIVNKILNYDPLKEQSTLCELVKLLNSNVFTPSSTLTSTYSGDTGGVVPSQRLNSSLSVGTNIQNRGANSLAIGNDIVIPSSASNVTVIGSKVTIPFNTTNTILLGSVSLPSFTSLYATIFEVKTNYTVLANDSTLLGNATTGNKTITFDIPSTYISTDVNGLAISKVFNISKIDPTANTITIATTTGNINGVTTIVLNTQYNSVTITTDGTNFFILK